MNQIPSHSQTPEFGTNKSQTTAILRQQPPSSKQIAKSNKRIKANAWMQNTFAAVVLFGTIGSATLTMQSCSSDIDHQHAQAIKHQLQFQASNGGTR